MLRSQGSVGQSFFRVNDLKCHICRANNLPNKNSLRSAADTIAVMPPAKDLLQLTQLCYKLRAELMKKEAEIKWTVAEIGKVSIFCCTLFYS